MSDAATRPPKDLPQQAEEKPEGTCRPCPVCTRSFRPKKPNQLYCSPKHRRRALRLREQADRLLQNDDRPAAPRKFSLETAIFLRVHRLRRRQGLPALEPEPYLRARAAVLEAKWQLKLWGERLEEREQLLHKLAPPPLAARYLPTQDATFTADERATHFEVVGSGEFAIVALGFKRE